MDYKWTQGIVWGWWKYSQFALWSSLQSSVNVKAIEIILKIRVLKNMKDMSMKLLEIIEEMKLAMNEMNVGKDTWVIQGILK